MSGKVRSELLKYLTGKATFVVAGTGVLVCAITAYGFMVEGSRQPGGFATGLVTDSMVRAWMMMLLFSAILGALGVVRDYSGKTMARTVLTAGGRTPTFVVKLAGAGIVGLASALLTTVLAGTTTALALTLTHRPVVWTAESTQTLIGVGACVVFATLWGNAIGWLVRNQAAAIMTIIVMIVVLEPAVQRLVPKASAYLFTIALSSLYRDGKPELLPIWGATAVAAVWVAVLAGAGHRSFGRGDVR